MQYAKVNFVFLSRFMRNAQECRMITRISNFSKIIWTCVLLIEYTEFLHIFFITRGMTINWKKWFFMSFYNKKKHSEIYKIKHLKAILDELILQKLVLIYVCAIDSEWNLQIRTHDLYKFFIKWICTIFSFVLCRFRVFCSAIQAEDFYSFSNYTNFKLLKTLNWENNAL